MPYKLLPILGLPTDHKDWRQGAHTLILINSAGLCEHASSFSTGGDLRKYEDVGFCFLTILASTDATYCCGKIANFGCMLEHVISSIPAIVVALLVPALVVLTLQNCSCCPKLCIVSMSFAHVMSLMISVRSPHSHHFW